METLHSPGATSTSRPWPPGRPKRRGRRSCSPTSTRTVRRPRPAATSPSAAQTVVRPTPPLPVTNSRSRARTSLTASAFHARRAAPGAGASVGLDPVERLLALLERLLVDRRVRRTLLEVGPGGLVRLAVVGQLAFGVEGSSGGIAHLRRLSSPARGPNLESRR